MISPVGAIEYRRGTLVPVGVSTPVKDVTPNIKAPTGRHNLSVTPLGLHYSIEYNGGFAPAYILSPLQG